MTDRDPCIPIVTGPIVPDRCLCRDRTWLLLACLVLVGVGIGLRNPWPPDEPRFVLIGADMAAGSSGLVTPTIRGNLYTQKPPLFFWLQAGAQSAVGSMRWGFLLPSLLAALATVWCTHDLAARLWGRRVAWMSTWGLLLCIQFLVQARSAQIDMVLCGLMTLSLYGLCRHLLTGPAPGWLLVGWTFAGLGVITKGVGFLPLLIILPALLLRQPVGAGDAPIRRWPRWPWWVGPFCLLGAIALWLVPMLLVTTGSTDPALHRYRDEILFGQTWQRYTAPTHHQHWFGYYLVQVIPPLWAPLSLLLPWVIPAWWRRCRRGDRPLLVLLVYLITVLVFFSISAGKRGVYVLPLLPVFCLALGPVLLPLTRRRWLRSATWILVVSSASLVVILPLIVSLVPRLAARYQAATATLTWDLRPAVIIAGLSVLSGAILLGRRRAFATLIGATLIAGVVTGGCFWPALDDLLSASGFMRQVAALLPPDHEVAMLTANTKEQFVLQADRPIRLFCHDNRDVAARVPATRAWLTADPHRHLLIDTTQAMVLFPGYPSQPVGSAHNRAWVLVRVPDGGMPAVGPLPLPAPLPEE